MDCDTCVYYEWDEETQEYYCVADMEEDDYARMMQEEYGHHERCPYWQSDDEYAVVAHQAFAGGPNLDRKDVSPERRYHLQKPGREFGGEQEQ